MCKNKKQKTDRIVNTLWEECENILPAQGVFSECVCVRVCVHAYFRLECGVEVCEEGVFPSQGQHSFLHHGALHIVVHEDHILLQDFDSKELSLTFQLCKQHLTIQSTREEIFQIAFMDITLWTVWIVDCKSPDSLNFFLLKEKSKQNEHTWRSRKCLRDVRQAGYLAEAAFPQHFMEDEVVHGEVQPGRGGFDAWGGVDIIGCCATSCQNTTTT